MEYNIERSSTVSMLKKERKLGDGKVVWDSVLKLRKKNLADCSKSPKKYLGMRNNWIKKLSNMLSEKASASVLETMCAERTSRQEEIAQTLLDRFNNILEQEASMMEPKTLTHKAMVLLADHLSLWLDKNVKVSKNVRARLQLLEEEEKKKRLLEEMKRLEQEKRDQEEEKKRKRVEEPPPETEPEDEALESAKSKTGDDKSHDEDREPDGEAQRGDGQQASEQEPFHPPPATDLTDTEQNTEGSSEYETDVEGTAEDSSAKDRTLNDADEWTTENEVPSGDTGNGGEEHKENILGTDKPSISRVVSGELDLPQDSPILKILDVQGPEDAEGAPDAGGVQNVEGTPNVQGEAEEYGEEIIDAGYPRPDVDAILFDTVGDNYQDVNPSEALESPEPSVPPSDSEFSGRDEINAEASKDTAVLVDELLSLGTDIEDAGPVDEHNKSSEIHDDRGKPLDDKTNRVLNELAEIIAQTPVVHSPVQRAIKDIVEKELEERLGDEDVDTINNVAGKVGTWLDTMVERTAEEYGERKVRSESPRPLPPPAVPQVPTPAAVLPNALTQSLVETATSPPPVSQKPKGPIFELRKVGPKNIFNVTGITNTKAGRKIREVRGRSTSRHISQESLDLDEWAQWAGLVSDVGQNWAKWIERVAQAVVKPQHMNNLRLSQDAKEWKRMNKELQREGNVWMQKVLGNQSKRKLYQNPKAVST